MEFSGWFWASSESAQIGHTPSYSHSLSSLLSSSFVPQLYLCQGSALLAGIWQGTKECIFFLAQVNELPSSTAHRENLEAVNDQRRPSTAPRETKRTRRKQTATSLHNKYDGYEELLTVKPDPAFLEPKGMGLNAGIKGMCHQALLSVRGFLGHGSIDVLC